MKDVEPTLWLFGLTPELQAWFNRSCPPTPKSVFWLPVATTLLLPAISSSIDPSIGGESATLLAILAGLPVWWFAFRRYQFARTQAQQRHQFERQAHPHYKDWLEFLGAPVKYSEFLRALKHKEYEELRRRERWWKSLDGWRFGRELGRLSQRHGCFVKYTDGSGDGGIDLILRKDGKTILVQCKAHKKYISRAPVAELFGTLVHYRARVEWADEAWLVATHGFSAAARTFAKGKPVRLLTIRDFLRSGNP